MIKILECIGEYAIDFIETIFKCWEKHKVSDIFYELMIEECDKAGINYEG